MKSILVLGAGRSSSSLITYLLKQSEQFGWRIIVGDASHFAAGTRVDGHKNGVAIAFNIENPSNAEVIQDVDVVISLLPPPFHPIVARHCLAYGKHLLTASYVSEEMSGFHEQAKAKALLFLNECGLDPGIDHMSAMQVIDRIRSRGGQLTEFESFTGGLIAPDTDPENPWRYKFTWNPKNVVMAGQGTAKFLQQGKYKFIPYQQLFKRVTSVHVPGTGDFEGYANRDSLKYIDTYKLDGVRTMLRGTLRNKGFCSAWNVFVQLGCCDDSYQLEGVERMTHLDFINSFLPEIPDVSVREKIKRLGFAQDNELKLLEWSGFFDATPVGLGGGTPAQVLEHILNKKWQLDKNDKDQIVMWHRFVFREENKNREIQASLVATGRDANFTAMADTVGLPLGIAAKLLLQGHIKSRGVTIPLTPEFYNPILAELAELGIALQEREVV